MCQAVETHVCTKDGSETGHSQEKTTSAALSAITAGVWSVHSGQGPA